MAKLELSSTQGDQKRGGEEKEHLLQRKNFLSLPWRHRDAPCLYTSRSRPTPCFQPRWKYNQNCVAHPVRIAHEIEASREASRGAHARPFCSEQRKNHLEPYYLNCPEPRFGRLSPTISSPSRASPEDPPSPTASSWRRRVISASSASPHLARSEWKPETNNDPTLCNGDCQTWKFSSRDLRAPQVVGVVVHLPHRISQMRPPSPSLAPLDIG